MTINRYHNPTHHIFTWDLTLWWTSGVTVDCSHISKNIIDSSVYLDLDGELRFITWIYEGPEFGRNTHNWNRLRRIGTTNIGRRLEGEEKTKGK